MDIFLEVSAPDELCRHLFLSFVRVPQAANVDGKTFQVSLFQAILTQQMDAMK